MGARYPKRLLERFRQLGDPAADAVVARNDPRSRGNFYRAWEPLPDWVDPARIERAQRYFLRHAVASGIVLVTASLVEDYAHALGAKVLVRTGLLNDETTVLGRVAETARFLVDVFTPGGLGPGGPGQRAALKVRLMHAEVRAKLLARGDWDPSFGVPINQEDLAITLNMFGHVALRAFERLGIAVPRSIQEDDHHLWRYVGHLLGIEPGLLPETYREQRDLYRALRRHQQRPDDDSRALARRLFAAMAGRSPLWLSRRVCEDLSRRLLGDALADALGLERSLRGRLGAELVARSLRLGSRAQDLDPWLRSLGVALGRGYAEISVFLASRAR